jgi:hypothetical protein
MAKKFPQTMTPILQRIASALIEATPDTWTAATMRVEAKRNPNGELEMPHSIWSDQHPKFAIPTDDLFAATYELQQLCEKAKKPWSALVFRIEQVGDDWKFTTDFEYPMRKRNRG